MIEIYALKNVLLGRVVYVGQTKKGLAARFKRHREHASKPDRAIAYHISKFGIENFAIELLEECEDQMLADAAEARWIKDLNTTSPNGCNVWAGSVRDGRPIHINARVSRTLLGHSVSEETRKKIKDARALQAPITEDGRARISAARKGKKLSAEHRQKIKESWKLRRLKK